MFGKSQKKSQYKTCAQIERYWFFLLWQILLNTHLKDHVPGDLTMYGIIRD